MAIGSLIIPGPKIELYKTGFNDVCKLGRANEGQKLSELVERISDPMVLALDAPWGAGKSIFLKCWVGAHKLENNGQATTVYYDAFRHDYMDDPLIGLVGVISDRLEDVGPENSALSSVKEFASKLARPAARIGLAVATTGLSEITGVVVDSALEAGSNELQKASDKFWKKEDGKRAAMKGFRDALQRLAATDKLMIVIDELDRCRPDYALGTLEVIKHFFDVPNVHFVLGVNLRELANCVRARYGAHMNGEKYLQKFITVTMPLVPKKAGSASTQMQIQHFKHIAKQIGLYQFWKARFLIQYLGFVDHHAGLSLRDVEKIATLAMVTPSPSHDEARFHIHIGLLILKILNPGAVERARSGLLTERDVLSVFTLKQDPDPNLSMDNAHCVWRVLITQGNDVALSSYMAMQDKFFGDTDPRDVLRDVIAETFDVFQVLN